MYGGLSLALLIVLALIAYSQLTAPPPVAEARLREEAVRGAPGATVEIIEYGAYGCPSCRAAHQTGILEQVMTRYGRARDDEFVEVAAELSLDERRHDQGDNGQRVGGIAELEAALEQRPQ